jgi:hypothetical protein
MARIPAEKRRISPDTPPAGAADWATAASGTAAAPFGRLMVADAAGIEDMTRLERFDVLIADDGVVAHFEDGEDM